LTILIGGKIRHQNNLEITMAQEVNPPKKEENGCPEERGGGI
jgi:hypothetical protein